MNGVFTVGDLKYLSRTGRIKGSVATIGNVLKIKPILRGNKDGYIVFYKNCRGRKSALNELVNPVCDNIVEQKSRFSGSHMQMHMKIRFTSWTRSNRKSKCVIL